MIGGSQISYVNNIFTGNRKEFQVAFGMGEGEV
jgi:hypothetical protein